MDDSPRMRRAEDAVAEAGAAYADWMTDHRLARETDLADDHDNDVDAMLRYFRKRKAAVLYMCDINSVDADERPVPKNRRWDPDRLNYFQRVWIDEAIKREAVHYLVAKHQEQVGQSGVWAERARERIELRARVDEDAPRRARRWED